MIVFPNAKINLGLNVISKRPDGYHNIETVFYPVPLYDALEVVPLQGNEGSFSQTGIKIEGDPKKNLVIKALDLLKQEYIIPEIDIFLLKKIPFGAGLGGGSADAACMLKLVNEWARLNLSENKLEEYAARLGADCAFFIRNIPVFAEGIGNIFSPVSLSLSGYYLVLVKPDIHVSTQEAYADMLPEIPVKSIKEILRQPIETWKNQLKNDFETTVFKKYPEIKEVKRCLYEQGALYASMSGSGSSVFGIFEKKINLEIIHETFILEL
ncbi:4-(cytidine 5'-diphospho)-2-C-methyl-D-erythritol kinase [Bacteroidales bacterium OttesenSCG-928-M06]|nr:4-(cytidine 5'-diphospho)-2-C-methyl-D-erythritol kinase [Bacteroidales bacterium OttesenSCG-928-M06]